MRLALIQQHATANLPDNLARAVATTRAAAKAGAELVAFAELALSPFYPERPASVDVRTLAEPIPGPTTDVFRTLARELGVVIVMNLFERAGDVTFDTSPVIDGDGTLLGRTRMVHITEYPCCHESQYYTPGDLGAPVFDTKVGRVGVAICYDRHYPEYMRALALGGAELVLVPQAGAVAEWPEGLYHAEMKVAAFQNGYFVALCNRVGKEECITFGGESFVCAPDGRVIARAPASEDHILYSDIDLEGVRDSHARRLFLRDRRPELYAEWFSGRGASRT